MRPMTLCVISLATLCASASPAHAGAPPVPAQVVLSVGDALGGSTVAGLNPVATDGNGRPGALVGLASGANVIWYDGAVVFNASTVVSPVLTGGEAGIGIGDTGRFLYSPSADGRDAVWTQAGLLLRDDDPIPGVAGLFSTFNSRTTMLPDGTAVWVGGYTSTAGGATEGRILLRANSVGTPVFQSLLRTGDVVGGFPVGTTGIGFNFSISDSGERLALILLRDTGSTATDAAVRIDTAVVAQEGSPVGAAAPGENWQGFAGVAINNAGNWLLAGDTSGATATDAFLAYNGVPQIREGSTLDGELIESPAALRAVSINNLGRAIHVWNTGTTVRKAFYAADAANLAGSRLLVRTGSALDLNADGTADATLVDILGSFTSTTAVNLAEDGSVYLHASYTVGAETRESLLRFTVTGDPVFADGFEPAPAPR